VESPGAQLHALGDVAIAIGGEEEAQAALGQLVGLDVVAHPADLGEVVAA
jgi:hypothetical protein